MVTWSSPSYLDRRRDNDSETLETIKSLDPRVGVGSEHEGEIIKYRSGQVGEFIGGKKVVKDD